MLKRERRMLDDILYQLNQGIGFILEDDTAIMRKTNMGSSDMFASAYYPDKQYCSIDKQIGSRLCNLYQAQKELHRFLENNK